MLINLINCPRCGYGNVVDATECANCHTSLHKPNQDSVGHIQSLTQSGERKPVNKQLIIAGLVVGIGGIICSLSSYLNASQTVSRQVAATGHGVSSYTVYWSLIILGIILLLRGLSGSK